VLVIVGSVHDASALRMAHDWAPFNAALLSCRDLSSKGWCYWPADRSNSRAVVDGKVVAERDIRGVLIRRPWIMEAELTHISAADREYVAAEMNAFLVSWLSSLECPVLNRPKGVCLCGPNWSPAQWVHAAAAAGIAVKPARAKAGTSGAKGPGSQSVTEVVVVGELCFGAANGTQAEAAKRLAQISRTPFLAVRFASAKGSQLFLSATAMPALSNPEIANAARDYLLARPTGDTSG
jgi:hypothetical protein